MGARPRAPACTKIFQKYFKKQLTNCQKRDIISKLQNMHDPLAQSVEHMTFNHGVRSSSLRWVTINERNHQRWFRSFIMLLTRPNFRKCEAFACFAHCCRVSAAILEAQSGVQSLRWVTTTQKTAPYAGYHKEVYGIGVMGEERRIVADDSASIRLFFLLFQTA